MTNKAAKAVPLGLALLSAIFLYSLEILPSPSIDATIRDHYAVQRLLSSIIASDIIPNDDPSDYDYLIIHYHKTGHEASYALTRLIRKYSSSTGFNTIKHDPLPKRDHDEVTKCPHVELTPGVIYVQAAPDFYCDVNVLAVELLHRGNDEKKGIKIVHLVRNPFRLAVSNYKYHSQDPTPERWVKELDVCAEVDNPIYPDLLMPTLGMNGVMNHDDFDSILNLCHSLFTTHPGLEEPDFYEHLLKLDPTKGLLLATTQLMRGRNGDITRMANNIIKMQQLQQLEAQANIAQHHLLPEKRIQVLTLAMEDFNQMPKETAMRFFDFVLGDHTSQEVKETIARKYEDDYLELVRGDHVHITKGNSDNAMLEAYLREHELFGRILGNIERVVEDALGGSD
mmetsp:Transcript_17111/g.31105  ORF Transcript_17111/g.31105 Transcript_17111/m.31105 type:complete len:396 (-) Transcript_17111:534-1721(-)